MRAPGGRVLLRRSWRAMQVVVPGVLVQDQPQVPFAGDQHPVQAFAAGAGDPPLGDRVRARRTDRRCDDPPPDSREHGIECWGELGVPVTDEELEGVSVVLEVHQEVAGLLGYPLTGGMDGDPGQVHPPAAVLDEEDRKSTRLNSSHSQISYAVFCLKKKKTQ